MTIHLENLRPRDFGRAIDFAIRGMNFKDFCSGKISTALYGRYAFYHELERATEVIAAYDGDRLVGVLLAALQGETPSYGSFWRRLYITGLELLFSEKFDTAADPYKKANKRMLEVYNFSERSDGEINFLAVDPAMQKCGIGSLLLAELSRRQKGKRLHLFTDSKCNWIFYERKGFSRREQKKIELSIHDEKIPMTCYLYAKTM